MDNPLRANIAEATGSHLSIHGGPHSIILLILIFRRVIGDDQAIGDHDSRGLRGGGEKALRMATIQHQSLVVIHGGQVLHGQVVLGPILKDTTIASVGDQFLGELGNLRVQDIHDHVLNGFALRIRGRIFMHRVSFHGVGRTETVHIDVSIFIQFLFEFG